MTTPFALSTLETVYWLALGIGLGLLVLSVVVGDLFDFFDTLDFEIAGTELSVVPIFFTFMAAFGAGGLIGIQAFGFGQGGSVVSGLVTGVAGGGLAALLFAALRRQEQKDGFELSQLVGERGRCTLACGPGKVGKVTVTYAGMSRSFGASAADDIAMGEEIVVADVIGSQLRVARPST
jgi:hypothetical protein